MSTEQTIQVRTHETRHSASQATERLMHVIDNKLKSFKRQGLYRTPETFS